MHDMPKEFCATPEWAPVVWRLLQFEQGAAARERQRYRLKCGGVQKFSACCAPAHVYIIAG
jgi:hypothetical protein